MMWPGGHQKSQNGWSASETSTVLKPRARSPSARKTCSSFSRSMSNASDPFEPLISHWNALRRPSACRVGLEPPRVERGVVAPVLEVAAAEVAEFAELAGLDQLPRQPHGGHEAVVEAAEVLDAGRRHALPDLV